MNARKDIERVQTTLKNEFLKNFQVKVEEERPHVSRNDPPTQPDIMSNLMTNKANNGMAMIAEKSHTPIFQLPPHFDSTQQKNASTFSSLLGTPAPAQPPSLFNQHRMLNLTPCNNIFNPSPVVGMNLFTSEGNTPMINMFELLNVTNKSAGQQMQQQSIPPSFLTQQQQQAAIQSMGGSPFNQNGNQIVLTNGLIMNPLRRPEPTNVQQQQQIAAILNQQSGDLANMTNSNNNLSSIFGNSTFQTQLSPTPMDAVSKSFDAVNLSSMSSPLHFQSTPQMNPFHSSFMATPQLNIRLPSLFSSPGQPSFSLGAAPNLFPLNASNLFTSTMRRFSTGEGNGLCDLVPSKSEQLGTYSKEERNKRIMRYKNKIQKWRQMHPVNRAFTGRSKVAGNKPRVKGRFVKNDELEDNCAAMQQPNPKNINQIDEIACETGNSSGSPNNQRLVPE